MARSLCTTVDEKAEGQRLDVFLAGAACYPSRSSAAKHIENGDVFVNGNSYSKKDTVCAHDVVVYTEEEAQKHIPLQGDPIPLDIRYDDDCMIVLSKQAGLCVHPAPRHIGATLVNALIYRYGRDHLAHIQGDDRPGIVHRLDMDTSGLMICAKQDEAGFALQDDIRLKNTERRYLTLVHGNIAHETGLIDQPIARNEHDRLRMCVSDRPSARPSITTFRVLERFAAGPKDDGYSLLECKLYTGRTHQIRVHMEYIHHCVVGDPMYKSLGEEAQRGLTRQFLHSYLLNVTHPKTGERLHFIDALPPDLQDVIDGLSDRSMGKTQAGNEVYAMLCDAPRQPETLGEPIESFDVGIE